MSAGTAVLKCRYHCSGCDRHFRSLDAFDMHRRGTGVRYCVVPGDDERLAALTNSGACNIVSPKRVGVTVWTLTRKLPGPRLAVLGGPESTDTTGSLAGA